MEMGLTVSQMKEAEKIAVEMGSSYPELMENAGVGSGNQIAKMFSVINRSCVILCGNGNNGGDGFVIARKLYEKGADVTVVLCKGDPATEESRMMYEKVKRMALSVFDLEADLRVVLFRLKQADLIIDTVFGTGFHGKITGMLENVIAKANESAGIKIAVDVPSGINGDSGKVEGVYFKADVTLALGAYKRVHRLEESAAKCGKIVLVDIGIPAAVYRKVLLQAEEVEISAVRGFLPKRAEESNKGDYGKLLIVAGSVGMGGAALMCTKAAMRCGVGLTTLATVKSVVQSSFPQIMEAMTLPLAETAEGKIGERNLPFLRKQLAKSTGLVIGCGLGNCAETEILVKELLNVSKVPVILDADGINVLSLHNNIEILKQVSCPVVLTPHPGEMARLTGMSIGEIQANREQTAYDFAREYGVIVVLKGHRTIVALPNGKLYRNITGNAGMAKGGSGDVLAGMMGGFAAQGIPLAKAAVLAVYLHGMAGDRCAQKYTQYGMIAGDLIREIPLAIKELLQAEEGSLPEF